MLNILLAKLNKTTDNRGFTFVEVLIVLAIFSIGVLAVALMQVTSINTNASARMAGEATALAANQVLMALPYDDGYLNPADNPHGFNQDGYSVSWNVTESDVDGDGSNDSKTIIVTVNCANPNAKGVSIQYIKPEA